MKNRVLAMLIILCMVVCLLPVFASADPVVQTINFCAVPSSYMFTNENITIGNYGFFFDSETTQQILNQGPSPYDNADFNPNYYGLKATFLKGEQLVLGFSIAETGTYNIDVSPYTISGYGMTAYYFIDNVLIGQVDYSNTTNGSGAAAAPQALSGMMLTSGEHKIKIVNSGLVAANSMYTKSITLTPTTNPRPLPAYTEIKNFLLSQTGDGQIFGDYYESSGWRVNTSPDYTSAGFLATPPLAMPYLNSSIHPVFGLKTSMNIGDFITFDIRVDLDGKYNVDYVVTTYSSGMVGEIYLDDAYLGVINCSSGSDGATKTVNLIGKYLSAGTHRVKVLRISGGGGTSFFTRTINLVATNSPQRVNFCFVPTGTDFTSSAITLQNYDFAFNSATTSAIVNDRTNAPYNNSGFDAANYGMKASFPKGDQLIMDFNVASNGTYNIDWKSYNIAGYGMIAKVYIDDIFLGTVDYSNESGGNLLNTAATLLGGLSLDAGIHTLTIKNSGLNACLTSYTRYFELVPTSDPRPLPQDSLDINFSAANTGDGQIFGDYYNTFGWKVDKDLSSPGFSADPLSMPYLNSAVSIPFGLKTTFNIDDYVTIKFNADSDGYYNIDYVPYIYSSIGAYVWVYVNDVFVGAVDDSAGAIGDMPTISLSGTYLTAGMNELKLVRKAGGSGGTNFLKAIKLVKSEPRVGGSAYVANGNVKFDINPTNTTFDVTFALLNAQSIETGETFTFKTSGESLDLQAILPPGSYKYNIYVEPVSGYTKYEKKGVDVNLSSVSLGDMNIYAGDVNGDGVINIIDIASLIVAYGQNATLLPGGDYSHNGSINIDDIQAVIGNIGKRSVN